MNLKEQILNDIYSILSEYQIEKSNIIVEKPKERSMADFAVPCFSIAKVLKKNPVEIANMIKEKLTGYEQIDVVNGYLNIFVNKREVTSYVINEVLAEGSDYGNNNIGEGKVAIIEYSSPNIAKPFNMGHIRTTCIGETLKNIWIKCGYKVHTINYLGDYGTQFGKLIYAYKHWGNEDAIKENAIAELKRIYVKFHEEAQTNPEIEDEGRRYFKLLDDGDPECVALWKRFRDESLREFNKTYDLLGINSFDSYDGEAYYKDMADDVVKLIDEMGIAEESDGAKIINLGEDKVPALIQKSDGTSLYITRDIATAMDRKKKYNFDECIYVVGGEQKLHFEQLVDVLKKMNFEWAEDIIHIGFGMVLQGGKKMSTRGGRTVGLHDVLVEAIELAQKTIEEKNPNLENKEEVAKKVGVGAVIFNDLKNYRLNDVEFNMESLLEFSGNTGPYLQYTYARICSLLKNKQEIEVDYEKIQMNEFIWNIVIDLYEFSDIIYKAKSNYDQSLIAKYLFDLAQDFNKLYANEKIVDEDIMYSQFKLGLCEAVAVVLKEGLRILGISALEKM